MTPSNVPKTCLQFEKPDGTHFALQVPADATVAQLKRAAAIEEKIAVHDLKLVVARDDPDDPEALLVSDPQDLPDDAAVARLPVAGATLFVCGPPPPAAPPRAFGVCVALDDGRTLRVEARLAQTLAAFRAAVRAQHDADAVLILVGRELVGEDLPLWDLGFVPGCVVHAVPFVSVTVELVGAGAQVLGTLCVHPLTRLSALRRLLARGVPAHVAVEKYRFTLDGTGHLCEARRLWDLDIVSGATLYMHTCVLSFTVVTAAGAHRVDAEEEETVWGVKERLALITGRAETAEGRMVYRGKVLRDWRTVTEEGLVGGETLSCLGMVGGSCAMADVEDG